MKLTIEALQANEGDCLLMHYQRTAGAKPVRILVDGGSAGIYRRVLKPRLDELRGDGRIDLRMVMVSHVDGDHISGILDLFRDLERHQEDGREAFCRIRTLWHNSFERVHGGRTAAAQSAVVGAALGGVVPRGLEAKAAAVVASIKQGAALRDLAQRLDVALNQGAAAELVRAPTRSVRRIAIAPGLTFTILGPRDDQLEALDEEWRAARLAHPADPQAQAADYLNRTVANLSSIVVLVEVERPRRKPLRILLTGDAGGDHILESLIATGIGGRDGSLHVDLLKVQHHGSNHSTTQDFFEKVTADRYVISGNGRHDIPHKDTLNWLSAARSGKPYELFMTNRKGTGGLTQTLTTFLAREERTEPTHRYVFRGDSELSVAIELK
jgi:beta-lactamase superfamily II metal-dependent hydrolase